MPELPRYQDRNNLPDTRSAQAQTDVSQATRVSRAAEEATQRVQAASVAFMKLDMANETTTAKVKAAQGISTMSQDIEQNPGDWTPERVQETLREIEADASAGFTYQEARDQFSMDYKLTSITVGTQANTAIRTYKINQRKVNEELEIESAYLAGKEAREATLDSILATSLDIGMYKGEAEAVAKRDATLKAWEVRDIKNTAETNPELALQMIEQMEHNQQNAELKDSLRKTVMSMKNKNEYQRELATRKAETESDNNLYAAWQNGNLTQSLIEQEKQANPFMSEALQKKWEAVHASKKALTGSSEGTEYMDKLSRLMALTDYKRGTDLKKRGLDPQDYREILQIKLDALEANANGTLVGEEFDGVMDIITEATTDNKKFMKNYSHYATILEQSRKWANAVSANIRFNQQQGMTVRTGADIAALRQGGLTADPDSLAMEIFNAFLVGGTDEDKAKQKLMSGKRVNPDELNKVFESVKYRMDERIAKSYYAINKNQAGVEYVQIDGGGFEVLGYANGSPLVDFKEINQSRKNNA